MGDNITGTNIIETLYLIYTDVKDSSLLDKDIGNELLWREQVFVHQLERLLTNKNSLAVKSIGDALFIIIIVTDEIIEQYKGEINFAAKVLNTLFNATNKIIYESDKKIEVRAAIHRITDAKTGLQIQLKDEIDGDRYEVFNSSLKNDIFNTEVNKTARMLSLVDDSAILVSEDIVKLFFNNDKEYLEYLIKKDKPPKIQNNLILHSPVPIYYLKGIMDPNNKSNPSGNGSDAFFTVWELSKENEHNNLKPILATEFKQYQVFRFLNLLFDRYINNNDANINRIHTSIFEHLELNKYQGADQLPSNKNIINHFYIDYLFKIEEYYQIAPIQFERFDKKNDVNNCIQSITKFTEKTNFIKSDNEIVEETVKVNGKEKTTRVEKIIFFIDGKKTILKLSPTASEPKVSIKNKNEYDKIGDLNSLMSSIAICSYPNEKTSEIGRYYLSGNIRSEIENKVKIDIDIQPQSFPIYKSICFTEEISKKLLQMNNENTIKLSEKYLLVFFSIYSNQIEIANSRDKIFKNIIKNNQNGAPEIIFYGLLPGVIDGFILYESKKNKEDVELSLSYILKNFLYKTVEKSNDGLYNVAYPISIYILNPFESFDLQKYNLQLLVNNASK